MMSGSNAASAKPTNARLTGVSTTNASNAVTNAGVARRAIGLIIGLIALGIALTPGAGARVGAFFAQLITG